MVLGTSGVLQASFSSVTLQWDASPDTNVVGYAVYNGVIDTSYLIRTDAGRETSATVTNLPVGVTNYFFVTAYDENGVESDPSNLIDANFPGIFPPPTLSAVPDQSVGKNGTAGPVSFTIGDSLLTASSLALRGTSSNPALVPNGNILFGGSDSNRTVIVVPALNAAGNAVITLTVWDGVASASRSFLLTVDPSVKSAFVYLPLEAETATVLSPMAVFRDPTASGGQFIATTNMWSGKATFTVDIPVSGAYMLWWRALALEKSDWSFTVFADDGASDIFDASQVTWTDRWRWARVNGSFRFAVCDSAGAPANQTVLPFTAGRHTITFSGLDPQMLLDGILLTNDRGYIPIPPVLTVPPDQTIDELTTLVVTNTAIDPHIPPHNLTFGLVSGPPGVVLDSHTGVLTWTPTEDQPRNNLIIVQVTNDAVPPLSEIKSFAVIVNEVNQPPILTVPPDLTINELSTLVVATTATDPDLPANALTFRLLSGPEGMTLDPYTGVLVWTPTEAQGPSTNLVVLQVADDGSPRLSKIKLFTIYVDELNSEPTLAPVPDQRIQPGSLLTVTNVASDPDIPTNTLTFTLGQDAPAGAAINPSDGVFTWSPTAAQADTTYFVTVWVSDNCSPSLSNSVTFAVAVGKLTPVKLTSATFDGGEIHLRTTGDPGITYWLQASTDLESWVSLNRVTAPSNEFEFVDAEANAFPFRFYRVTTAP